MLTLLEVPDHVLGVRIDGKIDVDDMDRMIREMNRKLEALSADGRPAKLRVYVEAVNFRGITLEALLAEIKALFPHLNDFEKKAVVSDVDWIETVTRVFTPLTDWWIEARHYRPDKRDEALTWVSE